MEKGGEGACLLEGLGQEGFTEEGTWQLGLRRVFRQEGRCPERRLSRAGGLPSIGCGPGPAPVSCGHRCWLGLGCVCVKRLTAPLAEVKPPEGRNLV